MSSTAGTLRRAASLLAVLIACAPPARAERVEPPTLVVLLTVDQLRADYLTRFGGQLRGGLARLVREGSVYSNAHHDHALPETAAGHATLLAGRFPRSTGIILNGLGVDDPASPLLDGAPGQGASPHRFRGTTLVDWMRARDPRTRVLSVSAKDRGAILPLGRAKGEVYWYASGRFTSSRYYADSLPAWVRAFNGRSPTARYRGAVWTPLLPDSAYAEPDSVSMEAAGGEYLFPHRVPQDSGTATGYLVMTPWMDELVLGFALEGLRATGVGSGPQVDLLNVSLSATDAIGHVFGPDSREMHDQVLRLDRALGAFLDSLYRLRDPRRVLVVLTSDHGVAPLPELSARRMTPPPMRLEAANLLHAARERLRAKQVDTNAVSLVLGMVLLDEATLAAAGIARDTVLRDVAEAARATPGVQRVDLLDDLRRANHARDAVARRWSQMLPVGATVPMVVTLAPYNIWWSDNVASHHSPHDYDTQVPLIFHGAAFRAGRHGEFVRTVDLAPTLAAALGVTPLEPVDGVVLRRALRD
ncbi:MAG TPA: alkaline phosphatase family protein [Gemmatimonadaceae bacterium]|nr:alkaline phosphatase family protein [Gemmatimonadaceae bacterium]